MNNDKIIATANRSAGQSWRNLDVMELPSWPRRIQLTVLLFSMLVAFFVAWLAWLQPIYEQIKVKQEALQPAQAELALLVKTNSLHRQPLQSVKTITLSSTDWIAELGSLPEQHGLQLTQIQPQQRSPSRSNRQTLSLSVVGAYAGIQQFLADVLRRYEGMEIQIERLQITTRGALSAVIALSGNTMETELDADRSANPRTNRAHNPGE